MSKKILYGSILIIVMGGVILFPLRLENVPRVIKFAPVALLSIGMLGLLTSLSFRRFLGAERADKLFINLTLSSITIIFMLVLGEFIVRFSLRDVTTTAEGGGYFDKSWYDAIQVNTLGFRERDFDLAKPEGTYRIAVIGDSITFGQGVGQENRFTNLLEDRLNGQNGRYEVLNFGLRRAETVDHLEFLKKPVLQAKPDFILLQWYTNDVEGHDKSKRPGLLTVIPVELRVNSALLSLLHGQLNALQRKLGLVESYEDYYIKRFGDPDSEDSLAAQKALQEFIAITKEEKIPMGIILYNNDPSLDFLAERVMVVCEREEITCSHLGSLFEPYQDDPVQLWASRLDSHPGTLAHRLIADHLIVVFGDVWLNG